MRAEIAAWDWGDVPTWVGAGSTVGALIAAGIAAWAAWKVLGVERGRDEQRRDAEDRVQADRVAAWPSPVRSNPDAPSSQLTWGAAIRNGSDLPIYQVHVEFHPIRQAQGLNVVVHELVSPGDWLLTGRTLYPRPEGGAVRRIEGHLTDRWYVIELTFTDAAGRSWHRDRQGVLTRRQP